MLSVGPSFVAGTVKLLARVTLASATCPPKMNVAVSNKHDRRARSGDVGQRDLDVNEHTLQFRFGNQTVIYRRHNVENLHLLRGGDSGPVAVHVYQRSYDP